MTKSLFLGFELLLKKTTKTGRKKKKILGITYVGKTTPRLRLGGYDYAVLGRIWTLAARTVTYVRK